MLETNIKPTEINPQTHGSHSPVSRRRFRETWRTFSENRLAVAGLIIIVIFGLLAITHPILMASVWPRHTYDPIVGYDVDIIHPSLPSASHLLGTDTRGVDVLSMMLAATTPTFIVGLSAALTTAIVGTAIGVASAYYRGKVDAFFSQITDVFLLLPPPIVMLVIGGRFREEIGPLQFGLIYGVLAGLSTAAAVMRAYAVTVMAKPYIDAVRIAGGGSRHIIFKHLMPHVVPMAALQLVLAVTGAVVTDGFISFAGLSATYLNWGSIVYISFAYSLVLGGIEWHVFIPPSVALAFFALGFYLVSRGMHRIADPRLRSR